MFDMHVVSIGLTVHFKYLWAMPQEMFFQILKKRGFRDTNKIQHRLRILHKYVILLKTVHKKVVKY